MSFSSQQRLQSSTFGDLLAGTSDGAAIRDAIVQTSTPQGQKEHEERIKRLLMLQIAQQLSTTLEAALDRLQEQVRVVLSTALLVQTTQSYLRCTIA